MFEYLKIVIADLFGPKPGELNVSRNDVPKQMYYVPTTDAKNIRAVAEKNHTGS